MASASTTARYRLFLHLTLLLILLGGCKIRAGRGPFVDLVARDDELPSEARLRPPAVILAAGGAAVGYAPERGVTSEPEVPRKIDELSENLTDELSRQIRERIPVEQAARLIEDEPVDEYLDPYKILIVPLPVFATSPNSGVTLGALPVILFQESARLSTIMAPRILYNEIRGLEGVFEIYRYFSRDLFARLKTGASTEGEQDHRVELRRRGLFDDFLRVEFNAIHEAELARRFWGLGPASKESDESSYVYRESSTELTFAFNLPEHFEVSVTARAERLAVGPGRIDDIPSMGLAYSGIPGTGDANLYFGSRLALRYDTRDSATVPSEGVFVELIGEAMRPPFGRPLSYARLRGQAQFLFPSFSRRLVTVGRIAASAVDGTDVPFTVLPEVGGKATNRGYGDGRFLGDRAWVANLEQRFNIFSLSLLDVETILQLAAFLDIGRVWLRGEAMKFSDAELALGGAIRLLVPDSDLVTSIDLGMADEGLAAFVGLDYPF